MNLKNLLILLLIIFTGTVGAKTKLQPYNVELLIFANDPKNYIDSENWVKTPVSIDFSKSLNIKSNSEEMSKNSSNQDTPFFDKDNEINTEFADIDPMQPILIAKEEYQLKNTAKKLANNKDKRIVFHKAWQQDFILEERTLPIYVSNVSERAESNYPVFPKGVDNHLKGIISIKKLRGFYHVRVDIALANKNVTDKVGYFRLKSDGKLKLGKIYYFDHPAFGMLMIIS